MKIYQQCRMERRRRAGQLLVMFAIMAIALIGFVGLALDAGNVYITRSVLSRSLDSAALTGIRSLGRGDAMAEVLARRAFAANYKGMGNEASPVALGVTFSTDTGNNRRFKMTATSVVNTYFMRIYPRFRTFKVQAVAEGTRANLLMAIILDRSGSMAGNGGSSQLPSAVISFLNYFDDGYDKVTMTSFASHATVNVAMTKPFKAAVTSAVNAMSYTGGTFADGGLVLANAQIQAAPVVVGENVIKVAVFFTDGLANEFQYTWPGPHTHNIGGYDSGNTYGIYNPSTGATLDTGPPAFWTFWTYKYISPFLSLDGTSKNLSDSNAGNNVRLEARLRVEATAATMRNNGITVYSVGLGNDTTINKASLMRIANDPASTTYDHTKPEGLAVFTPNSTELKQLFDIIAARILLRLTQ